MTTGWEQEAENWVRWARTQGHDAYWDYSPAFFEQVVPPPKGLTLEIGCGEGRVTRDLRDRGHQVVSVDSSATLVRYAVEADPQSSYIVAEAESLPFGSSHFELIVAYNSLMDVADMRTSVRESARVLTPDGRLCMCVTHPMADAGRFASEEPDSPFEIKGSYYGPRRIDETFERDGLEITFHGWMYALEDYTNALADSGFVIELIREPRSSDEAVRERPRLSLWQRIPMFLFLRAKKTSNAIGI